MPRALTACIAALAVVSFARAAAQDVTEPSLKAAFLYHFANFTEWPADTLPAGTPLVSCVIGDTAVADALERMVKGRQVTGRSVTIVRASVDAPPPSCHLLYVPPLPSAQLMSLMAGLRGSPVLTVIDSDHQSRVAAVVRLYVEAGSLRFDVDHGLAKRVRLQVSSKLLTLAKKVFDERGVAP